VSPNELQAEELQASSLKKSKTEQARTRGRKLNTVTGKQAEPGKHDRQEMERDTGAKKRQDHPKKQRKLVTWRNNQGCHLQRTREKAS
jgi:hypothetical protein